MIASRQRDRVATNATRTHARGDGVEDSHIQARSVALTDSHMRQMAIKQFCAPGNISIWHKGSRLVVGWTRDPDNESADEDVQALVEDDRKMVVETEVTHHSEMEALTTTEVTPQTFTEVPTTSDVEVTPLVEIEVITPASIELSIHIDKGFFGELDDYFVLTKYVNHVAFRLWQRDVCICYVELDFIYHWYLENN